MRCWFDCYVLWSSCAHSFLLHPLVQQEIIISYERRVYAYSDSWDFLRTTVHTMNTMKTFGLVQDDKPVAAPRKRERPRKTVDPNQPKRRPGRPRKKSEAQES